MIGTTTSVDQGLPCKQIHVHTIRVAPPPTITANEVVLALQQLARVFEQLAL